MPGQIELCGLPASLSGQWIAVVGACNVIGSLAAGAAIERVSMKHLLASLYALRALGVALFLAAPKNEATMFAFAVWMGLTYMATLAPTSGLVGKLFGTQRLATLLGVVMLIHQVGAFLGVWLGGVALEATGSLDWIWYADIALAVAAVALHLPIREDSPAPRSNASVVVVGPRSATAGS
jgi:predicted MFS family arabinose efflux permease